MIIVHRFLIGTAICFCLGFAAWSFAEWRAGAGGLALAVVFACAGAALAYYLKHLDRFLRHR